MEGESALKSDGSTMPSKISEEPISTRLKIDCEEFLVELYHMYANGKTDEEVSDWWSSLQPDDLLPNEIFRPTAVQLTNIRYELGLGVKRGRHAKALNLKEWFRLNPHLPQPSVGMIHKFMWAAKDDEELCKKTLNKYLSLRGNDDELFGERDTCSPEAEINYKTSIFACIPKFTEQVYRVNISVLADYNPDNFSAKDWMRRIFYVADLRVRDDFALGEIVIYDLKGFSLSHLVKFQLSLVRKMIIAAERALPTRLKQIHLVNCPPFVDKVTSLFKPFLKEKLANRVIVHMDDFDELYKYIPKESLPFEYGGSAGSIIDFSNRWISELRRNRDWFLSEEKRIKRIYYEGQRTGKIFFDSGELFGMEGSFKKLAID